LVDRWIHHFGTENTEDLCQWNNRPPVIYARINHLKIPADAFLSECPAAELVAGRNDFVRLSLVPEGLLASGFCYVQDPSTAAACELLEPAPGERLLDACAAPGGKTGYLAQFMRNRGELVACDNAPDRVARLKNNLERLGVTIARFVAHDWTMGTPLPEDISASSFDRILVDAPCSNTGVMRRRVDVRWRVTPNDFRRMQQKQLRILRATVPMLKPAGALVYSTCSLEPEENEEVVAALLKEFSFLRLAKEMSLVPFRDGFDGAYAAKLIREK
jgi:16S rRNA (cytosine967-C5)-methyltransferase